jgi:hypothetical protein
MMKDGNIKWIGKKHKRKEICRESELIMERKQEVRNGLLKRFCSPGDMLSL